MLIPKILLILVISILSFPISAQTVWSGTTEIISVSTNGEQGNNWSYSGSISADGRFVAFDSDADNLEPDDTNGERDVFVHDRQTGQTTRVSVSSDGDQANDQSLNSTMSSISADGRFITFTSNADNLVPDDTNGARDVFVHDRQTGQTTRVSVSSDGEQANGYTGFGSTISADGRFVAFFSNADNLLPGDTNSTGDAFVHDRQTGQTTMVSVSSDGDQTNGCNRPAAPIFIGPISADGRFVFFSTCADNLVPNDTNDSDDIFVHDRQTGQTTRVNVSSDGDQANGESLFCSISTDGRFVAFDTDADNLVPDDTNGARDVFVHDRQTGQTTRVSVSSDGDQANDQSLNSTMSLISADGRFITFTSNADNLVPDDTNGTGDAFVHDRQTGQTTRVSVSSDGEQANGYTGFGSTISADGRFITFTSNADNLVPDDTNDTSDVFVHDRYPEVLNQPPEVFMSGFHRGPPMVIEVTAQDTGSGIATIDVTIADNAMVTVPPFSPGTNDPIVITAEKIDQSQYMIIELEVTDMAGNLTVYWDPVVTTIRERGKPVSETITNIPYAESIVTIYNNDPGIKKLEIIVNGEKFKVKGLEDNEVRTIDVASAMVEGNNNTIVLRATGKPGTSAEILISE